jgi:hypothetical protein
LEVLIDVLSVTVMMFVLFSEQHYQGTKQKHPIGVLRLHRLHNTIILGKNYGRSQYRSVLAVLGTTVRADPFLATSAPLAQFTPFSAAKALMRMEPKV